MFGIGTNQTKVRDDDAKALREAKESGADEKALTALRVKANASNAVVENGRAGQSRTFG